MADRDAKGRYRSGIKGRPELSARGSGHGMSKLTEDQVMEIRRRHKAGDSYRVIGIEFGIAKSYVGRIVRGKNWSHLPSV
jgi:hypothetical protein